MDLVIKRYSDARKLKKLFDDGEYSRNRVSRVVCCLLDNVLAIENFVGHQLTVFLFEVSEHVCHGVIDGVFRVISDIHKILCLDRGNDMLHKSLFESCHLSKQTHFLGVCDSRVRIIVGGCSIWDD